MSASILYVFGILVAASTISHVSGAEATADGKCVNCDSELEGTIRVAAAAVKSMEPFKLNDKAICQLVTLEGLKSMGLHAGSSCLKRRAKNQFTQIMTLDVAKIDLSCKLHEMKKACQELVKLTGLPVPPLPPMIGLGGDNFIKGTWSDVHMTITFDLDMDELKHNVTDCDITDKGFTGLKLWWEGQQLTKITEMFTKPDAVRALLGSMVKYFATGAIADALKDKSVADKLTALNCAETEYDD